MTRMITIGLLLTALMLAGNSYAEVAVIVHKDNPVDSLSTKDLKRIFQKKTELWNNGLKIKVYEPDDKSAAKEFYDGLLEWSAEAKRIYWNAQIFKGKGTPPLISDTRALLEEVAKDKGAIGFVDAARVSNDVKRLKIE